MQKTTVNFRLPNTFNHYRLNSTSNIEKINKTILSRRNIRKRTRIYSINIKNKMDKKMRSYQIKNKFRKNIFNLLYVQIRSDIKTIDNEIETAKKFVESGKDLTKKKMNGTASMFRPKLPILDLNENNSNSLNETSKKNNIKLTSNKSTKLINQKKTRNSLFFQNKKYLPSSFSNEKFKIYLTENNNNNKCITDRLTEYSNSNNNLINATDDKINNTLSNKTVEISNRIRQQNLLQKPSNTNINLLERKKTLYITYDPNWYSKNSFIQVKFDKSLLKYNYIQKQIINDQISLAKEHLKFIESKCLNNTDQIINLFGKVNILLQQVINANFEEILGLMIEISYLFFGEYKNNLKLFVSKVIEKPKKSDVKKIIDEKKEFGVNISIYRDVNSFYNLSYKTYEILLQKDENFSIKVENFIMLVQFLDRLRLGLSKLSLDINNIFDGYYNVEKRIISECIKKIKKINDPKEKYEKREIKIDKIGKSGKNNDKKLKKKIKTTTDCYQKFCEFSNGINPFNFKGPKKIKTNEITAIQNRINRALGDNKRVFVSKYSKINKLDLNSKLINDLMIYGTKQFKADIISERIRQRYYNPINENVPNSD